MIVVEVLFYWVAWELRVVVGCGVMQRYGLILAVGVGLGWWWLWVGRAFFRRRDQPCGGFRHVEEQISIGNRKTRSVHDTGQKETSNNECKICGT